MIVLKTLEWIMNAYLAANIEIYWTLQTRKTETKYGTFHNLEKKWINHFSFNRQFNCHLHFRWTVSRSGGNTWAKREPRRGSRWGRRGGRGRSTCSCWRRRSCWPRGSGDPSWARSSRTQSNGVHGQASHRRTSHSNAPRLERNIIHHFNPINTMH